MSAPTRRSVVAGFSTGLWITLLSWWLHDSYWHLLAATALPMVLSAWWLALLDDAEERMTAAHRTLDKLRSLVEGLK